jgi:hypothetical protein
MVLVGIVGLAVCYCSAFAAPLDPPSLDKAITAIMRWSYADIDAIKRGREITAIGPAQPRGACAESEIPGDLSGEASMTTTTRRR